MKPASWIDQPRKLFLLDGLGALGTALALGIAHPNMRPWFSMPWEILYPLAGVAGLFCLYSFTCHTRFPANWRAYLRGIAIANLAYCGFTLFLVLRRWSFLTFWDLVYFGAEIGIVVALAGWELRIATKS
ncbi:MAG: hypothetical protein AAFZ52_09710 [Bacteroidota bacterium]